MPAPRIYVDAVFSGNEPGTETVQQLLHDLESSGAIIVSANEQIAEEEFARYLDQELSHCHYFLFVQTPRALQSLRAYTAVRMALERVTRRSLQSALRVLLGPVEQEDDPLFRQLPCWNYPGNREEIWLALGLLNSTQKTLEQTGPLAPLYATPSAGGSNALAENDSMPVDPSGLLSIASRPFLSFSGLDTWTTAPLLPKLPAEGSTPLEENDSTPVDPSGLLSIASRPFLSFSGLDTWSDASPAQLPTGQLSLTGMSPAFLDDEKGKTTDPPSRQFPANNLPGTPVADIPTRNIDPLSPLSTTHQPSLLSPPNNLLAARDRGDSPKNLRFNLSLMGTALTSPGWRSSSAIAPSAFHRRAGTLWQRPSSRWIGLIAVVLALVLLFSFETIVIHMTGKNTTRVSRPNISAMTHLSGTHASSTTSSLTPSSSGQMSTPVTTSLSRPTPTSVPGQTPIPQPTPTPTPAVNHQTIVDNLSDWSLTYSHTANLQFDKNNNQWMHGDTSLLYRLANTSEAVVWKLSGMTSFQAILYFWPPQSSSPLSDLGVSTSSDGVHWTAVMPIISGGTGNWIEYTYNLTDLSNVNFVQMYWSVNSNNDWAQQIGQVTLKS